MNAIIYPLHFHQRVEQRWAAKMTRDESSRSPSRGTNTCTCGHVVTAPSRSTYAPTGVINEWQCSACGNHWETTADPGTASLAAARLL
jgi:hypothetical protein